MIQESTIKLVSINTRDLIEYSIRVLTIFHYARRPGYTISSHTLESVKRNLWREIETPNKAHTRIIPYAAAGKVPDTQHIPLKVSLRFILGNRAIWVVFEVVAGRLELVWDCDDGGWLRHTADVPKVLN